MSEIRLINNLKGTLYYLDTPILDFRIEGRKLLYSKDLSDCKYSPPELALHGVSYGNINAFFKRRTMK